MASFTPNYNLDLYDSTDKPNLRDQYNGAMNKLDTLLETQQQNINTAMINANQALENSTAQAQEISELQTGLGTANTNITSLQGDMTTAKSNIQTLQTDMTEAQGNIETLQSDVTQDKSDIAELQAKVGTLATAGVQDFVAIGDSYLEGYSASGSHTGWGQVIAQKTGKNGYIYSQGGIGFDANALTQLTNAMEAHPDIPMGFIVLGINNRTTTYNSIVSGAQALFNKMVEYPNTHFYMFPCVAAGPNVGSNLLNVEKAVFEALSNISNPGNISVFSGCYTWLIDHADWYDTADNLHPTQAGQNAIASSIIDAVSGGDPTVYSAAVEFTAASGCTYNAKRSMLDLCISFYNATATDGNAFLTLKNPQLHFAQVYNFALKASDGSTCAFNSTNGLSLNAAYGDMSGGYGCVTVAIEND